MEHPENIEGFKCTCGTLSPYIDRSAYNESEVNIRYTLRDFIPDSAFDLEETDPYSAFIRNSVSRSLTPVLLRDYADFQPFSISTIEYYFIGHEISRDYRITFCKSVGFEPSVFPCGPGICGQPNSCGDLFFDIKNIRYFTSREVVYDLPPHLKPASPDTLTPRSWADHLDFANKENAKSYIVRLNEKELETFLYRFQVHAGIMPYILVDELSQYTTLVHALRQAGINNPYLIRDADLLVSDILENEHNGVHYFSIHIPRFLNSSNSDDLEKAVRCALYGLDALPLSHTGEYRHWSPIPTHYPFSNGQTPLRESGIGPASWSRITHRLTTVVGLLDSGINSPHIEFSLTPANSPRDYYRLLINSGYNAVTNTPVVNQNCYPWVDYQGHGTMVASIISSRMHGMNSVTCDVLFIIASNSLSGQPLPVADRMDTTIRGLNWLRANGAMVITAAFGYANMSVQDYNFLSGYVSQMNAVLVSAANQTGTGNPNLYDLPARLNLPNTITVGGINSNGAIGVNYLGYPFEHIWAWGRNFLAADGWGNQIVNGARYSNAGVNSPSSSMATALVAGAIAQFWPNHPRMTTNEVKTYLYSRSPIINNSGISGRRLWGTNY
jgi:subtilisin family serine protease